MNKIFLIIVREYLSRIRKKSFIIMTFLGPMLIGGIILTVFLLNRADKEKHTIVIVDESHLFEGKFNDNEKIQFVYLNDGLQKLREESHDKGYFGILHIPATEKLENLEKGITLYSESQPGFDILDRIKFTIEKEIKNSKMLAAGIDDNKLEMIRTHVEIKTRDLADKETSTGLATGLGFGGGLLIYMFIFIYGAMVMRGVMEEKMSRIVEVMISSVKPFQLMMGKIVGVALVGLTQFLLWVILSSIVTTVVIKSFSGTSSSQEQIEQLSNMSPALSQAEKVLEEKKAGGDKTEKIMEMINTINFPVIIGAFIFFFLGGYFLYSALFAAIGAAVDSDTDVQQFMFPVTIPLVLAYVVSASVMSNPNGAVAFWFSMIPFTSPIIMMLRIPFGVPFWQVGLSILLLIGGFVLTTWFASKIYRTGILMYGKKVNYREIWKWIRYSN